MRRKYLQLFPSRNAIAGCYIYKLGLAKRLIKQNYWERVFGKHFPALCIHMVLAALITIAGVIGE